MITAVQQIMLGTLTNNYENALKTLKEIRETGYDAIELNNFMITKTGFLVKMLTKFAGMPTGNGGKLDWKKLIQESELKVSSLHYDLGSLERNAKEAAKKAKDFKTKYIVITGMYRFNYQSSEEVKKLCERLNAAGKALLEEGIELLYHNHNVEFVTMDNKKKAYDCIIENTSPEYVNFEFDSYWPTEAGVNAISVMEKLGKRMKLYHINDRGNRENGPYMTPILKSDCMELGTGTMDLDAMLNIAKENGTEAVILETHKNFIDKSPMKSIQISYLFLKDRI